MAVVAVALIEPHARQDLGDKDADHVGKCAEHAERVFSAHELAELGIDPLGGDGGKRRTKIVRGGCGVLFDGKAEHGGKAKRAQNAKRVLIKPFFGVADAADDAAGKIALTAERVDDAAGS